MSASKPKTYQNQILNPPSSRSFHNSLLFFSKPNIYRLVCRLGEENWKTEKRENFSSLIDFKLHLIVQLHENCSKPTRNVRLANRLRYLICFPSPKRMTKRFMRSAVDWEKCCFIHLLLIWFALNRESFFSDVEHPGL